MSAVDEFERTRDGHGHPGGSLVSRDRLVGRLVGSVPASVVLIDAPAGFGKSTVLRQWSQADPRPFARVTLGVRHDDPVLLTASIAEALADHSPVDGEVYAALHGSSRGALNAAVPRLLKCLGRASNAAVLVLDDLHSLTDPESLSVVSSLAEGLPGGWQLALASRTEPAIRLSRLRANGALTQLTAADLAMTQIEASTLLKACGLDLRGDTVARLVERTEGWPAALYLAALSLQDADDPDGAALEFAGDDRVVADYLRDEFISSLAPADLAFLTRTSILEEVSGEICDRLLATEGAIRRLRGLARANTLVHPLGPKDGSFRYHALLRGMLKAELHALHPREAADLHARAGAFYAESGDFDRAVPHLIAAGDLAAAGDMIWFLTPGYASAGRYATLELWLREFTEAQIAGSPQLALVTATCALSDGDGAAVEHWANLACGLIEADPRPDGEALTTAATVIRAAGSARQGVVRMREDVQAAFATLPEEDRWRSLCRLIEGAALHLTGERDHAREAFEDGARRGAVQAPSIHAQCVTQLALMMLEDEDLDEAARLSALAVSHTHSNGLADEPTSALTFSVAALVAARRGEAARAGTHAKRAAARLAQLNEFSAWFEIEARVMIARTLVCLDDVAAARAELAAAGRRLRHFPDAPVLRSWLEQAWREADTATAADRWPLTPAELRLLHQLPTHLSFKEIAEELFVSANTVKTQARSIYRKLGVSSRAEAVACARTAGLLTTEPITRIE